MLNRARIGIAISMLATLLAGCGGDDKNEAPVVMFLMGGQNRQMLVDGVQAGFADLGYSEDKKTIEYKIFSAEDDNDQLPALAQEIVASKPNLAIAAGGLEADALHAATDGTDIPVVFVGVSSSIDRGIVASWASSGNNLTGVDTAYTRTTSKRLEILHQIMPDVKTVATVVDLTVPPSVESLPLLLESAPTFDIDVVVFEADENADFSQIAQDIAASEAELLFQLPSINLQRALTIFYPVLSEHKIPIMGAFSSDLELGAFAFYGGDQFLIGKQGARIADQVLKGVKPADIPIENPNELQLTVNRAVINALDIELSDQGWQWVNTTVDVLPAN